MDFSKVLIHASSMGCLFTEPREVAAKKAGELSKTAKAHLIKVYASEYWGRRRDISTKQMEKGTTVESDIIRLLSWYDGYPYEKNEERREDEWITGIPDIVCGDGVIDVKASWDAETFLPKLVEPIDDNYYIQLQCYMSLFNCKMSKLVYGLVSMPDHLLKNELQRLLYSMNVATELNPDYVKAANRVVKNNTFDDIPAEERIICLIVPRNEEIIQQIPSKVHKARKYLAELHEKHINLRFKRHLSIDSVVEVNT